MPTFDIVSEIDKHELSNAIDQANREIENRFDFKDIDASYSLSDDSMTLNAEAEFQIKQMRDILEQKLAKRGIDLKSLQYDDIEQNMQKATQTAKIVEGISKDEAKKIVKLIKDSKIKVQASIQGDKVRVTGKKRDELQQIIAMLKDSKVDIPLQYNNFRD